MTRIAYLDESYDKARYIVATVAVDHDAVAAVRRQLRGVAPKGVARRHMAKESDPEKRKLLDTFKALHGIEVAVWIETRPGSVQRRRGRALEEAVRILLAGGLDRLVLDHVDIEQQQRDHQALGAALHQHRHVTFSYEPAHSPEPMLWIPDATAWCARRGGRWRRELDGWATIHRP